MEPTEENLFDNAMARYQAGDEASSLVEDFEAITTAAPNQAAGWTCLAWLLLLSDQPERALRSARTAVKLNGQDPQARINLSLALLETKSKGVRDQIDIVQKIISMVPELEEDLKTSIADGLNRKPNWKALEKIKAWLVF